MRRDQYVRWQRKREFQTLAGVAVTIDDNSLTKITVEAERALQDIAVQVAELAKRRVRANIKKIWPNMLNRPYSDGDIIDTGALYDSIYVAYPGSQRVQAEFRRKSRKTQASKAVSFQSTRDFRKKVSASIRRNPTKLSYGRNELNAGTQRFEEDDEGADTLTQQLIDKPINEFVKSHRANLYVAVGVAVAHGIFPHEGRRSGRGGSIPPRPFFAPAIEQMQRDFANRVGSLEQYMTKGTGNKFVKPV